MALARASRWVLAAFVALPAACIDTGPSRRPATARPPSRAVDVELRWEDAACELGASGPYVLLDASGDELGGGASLPTDTRLASARGRVWLAGVDLGAMPVEIRPLGHTLLSVQHHAYRGSLLVVLAPGGRARLLSRVPLEEYLLGVVPDEMPDRFGLEALKAQAVAARTYALEVAMSGRVLMADDRSQVYGGLSSETPLATRAVRETEGQVVMKDGQLHPAWFHSTCGGRTATAASVFDNAPGGWLDRPVVCLDCSASPVYRWLRRYDAADVCAAAGLPKAPLQSVTVKLAADERRPEAVVVRAGGQESTVDAAQFRARLSKGRPRREQLLSTHWPKPPRLEGGQLVIEGRGWGHGVGLCQFGAAGFAARGGTFQAILHRYYPGAQLATLR